MHKVSILLEITVSAFHTPTSNHVVYLMLSQVLPGTPSGHLFHRAQKAYEQTSPFLKQESVVTILIAWNCTSNSNTFDIQKLGYVITWVDIFLVKLTVRDASPFELSTRVVSKLY